MQARRRSIEILIATAALLAAGCSSDSGVSVTDRTDGSTAATDSTPTTGGGEMGTLDWGKCTDDAAKDETLECATLTVPLDYDHPDGDTIALALVRAPATASREGAVLFNPGGPGASGFDPIAASGTFIQSELGLDHFDLIGFDPRGVDRSGGIQCVDAAFQDAHLYLDDTPDTPEEQQLLDEADTGFEDGCVAKYGDTLKFYSTANTARDMDAIRAGLGDEQISYLGISYGTYLGGVYATLFPDRVRAMVLDSAYEPNGDTVEEQYLTQLVGFEGAFNDWLTWCEGESACAFKAADVGARWDALRQQLDDHPLADSNGREINQATLERATTAALYSKGQWPVLGDALAAAENGDGTKILAMADEHNGRHADGTFDTLFQSISVIRCASGITTEPAPDPQALLSQLQTKAPRFSKGITLDDLAPKDGDVDGCARMTGAADIVKLDYKGAGPIVVVGGTNDPATPIRWAEEMTAELGDNARMVTFTGEGHGQLLASTCVTEIEAALLAELTLPDEGTVCDPDPTIARPDWFDELQFPSDFSDVLALSAVSAALGVPETVGYTEVRSTDLSAGDAAKALKRAFEAAGFTYAGSQDLKIDDVLDIAFFAANGDLLVVVIMGPKSFDTDELGGLKTEVPAGTTVVLYGYLPQ